jgi:hypothetical protein
MRGYTPNTLSTAAAVAAHGCTRRDVSEDLLHEPHTSFTTSRGTLHALMSNATQASSRKMGLATPEREKTGSETHTVQGPAQLHSL